MEGVIDAAPCILCSCIGNIKYEGGFVSEGAATDKVVKERGNFDERWCSGGYVYAEE